MANNSTAYGFISLRDVWNMPANTNPQTIGRVWDAITETLDAYNQILDGLMGTFVQRTVVAMEQVELAGSGTLQPLDEWGNPLPVQPSGSYQVAYPIQGGGTAWGDNRVSREFLTVNDINRFMVDALQRDKDWLIRHILAALLTNTTWTYDDRSPVQGARGLGPITIQPLANNDAVVYGRTAGVPAATDNHYLAQAAAISDGANPFPTLAAKLNEHPSNSGDIVAYVASDLVPAINTLTEFVEVGDADIIPPATAEAVRAPAAAVLGPARQVLGKTRSGVWIAEMPIMPSGYMVAVSLGADPVLRMREYDAPKLQGFFPETFNEDGNRIIRRMIRYAGFGVRNRVGAVAMRIGNASYATPAGFAAPLPV